MNLGIRVNQFGNLFTQTVETFNMIFTEAQVTTYTPGSTLEIGEVVNTYYRRLIIDGKHEIIHDMRPLRELDETHPN